MQTVLESSQLIELSGNDAAAFAQSQFMNDVALLADGQWQWNGLLNPKGRLIAFFAIARVAADRLVLWLPDGGGEALRTHLQRFVFRSKVSLEVPAGYRVIAQFGQAADIGSCAIRLEFPPDPEGTPRRLIIALKNDPETASSAHSSKSSTTSDGLLARRWRRADLALGVPYITAGSPNSEQFVPQWLSLDRLDAFSLKKGCYPGQEIVARMHYLGQSKRGAFVLTGDGSPPPPMTRVLDQDGKAVGEVVWSLAAGSGWSALAVLAKNEDLAIRPSLEKTGGLQSILHIFPLSNIAASAPWPEQLQRLLAY